jgi:hypothetical protein
VVTAPSCSCPRGARQGGPLALVHLDGHADFARRQRGLSRIPGAVAGMDPPSPRDGATRC